MLRVAIDPSLAVLPSTQTSIERRITQIIQWNGRLRQADAASYAIAGAFEALADDGSFPLDHDIGQRLRSAGIVHLSAHDVVIAITTLLSSCLSLEREINVKAVLLDAVESKPHLPIPEACGPVVVGVSAQLFECVALCIAKSHLTLVGVVTTQERAELGQIHVEGLLEDVEIADVAAGCLLTPPFEFQADVVVFETPADLIRANLSELLRDATSTADVSAAVYLAALRMAKGEQLGANFSDLAKRFAVGPRFATAILAQGPPGRESMRTKILRAAAEVVLGVHMEKSHALRQGPGGNDPQIVDGSRKAWRHDVDHEWHLHYWRPTSAGVELASLGPHNSFSIPDCSAP